MFVCLFADNSVRQGRRYSCYSYQSSLARDLVHTSVHDSLYLGIKWEIHEQICFVVNILQGRPHPKREINPDSSTIPQQVILQA